MRYVRNKLQEVGANALSYEQTKRWIVDKNLQDERSVQHVKEAALWIKKGHVVAFPTETVYGLGANALDEQAVEKIFKAKGRPSDNPLIVHIAKKEQLTDLVAHIPEIAHTLIERFWPGPLTLIFKKKALVAPSVTAGLQTIAVRIPDHPVARAIILEANVPVAAPSANVSGKPSPTTAAHVWHDLQGRIAGIVDSGQTGFGVESTVLDCSTPIPVLYRPGGVSKEEIEKVIGPIRIHDQSQADRNQPTSPGLKYTHYAPEATLYLVEDINKMDELIALAKKQNKRVGLLITEENKERFAADVSVICGRKDELHIVANKLFDSLRTFDQKKVDVIFAETFPKEGLGAAIMNRLEKAASSDKFM